MSLASEARPDERLFAAFVAAAVDAVIVIDAQGLVEVFNPAAERLFGYAAAEVMGRDVGMLMPASPGDEHDRHLSRFLAGGATGVVGVGRDIEGKRRDGTIVPLHISVSELSIDGALRFVGVLHDQSARVALEVRLRTAEERWRSVVESAVDGVVIIDARGHIEAFNPAAQRLFGYTEADLLGRNVNILMPAPYHDEHDGYMRRYLESRDPRIIGIGREVSARRSDGTVFPVHLAVGEMVVGGDRKFTGILRDLTARVQLEERLREQAALASLGEMAALVAHEVKNPLAGIRGAVQVIGQRLPAGSKEAAVVADIVSRIDSLNGFVQEILLFARPPRPRPSPMEPVRVVSMAVDLFRSDPALAGTTVEVAGSAPPIQADAGLLQNVFLNLLINASHAMGGRGAVRVTIGPAGPGCRIAFADSGPGIPPEILDKVFSPFFTTKAQGAGLGLATAKRLVEAHQGQISIACPAEGGTVVTVELPSSAPALSGSGASPI
jgi:two-component system sensor kinase FixL